MVKCQSCGGSYEPIQTDGTQYFHRCPPLSIAELAVAVDDGRVTLPKGETLEDAHARRIYEPANLRDENVPSMKTADAGKRIADGAGAVVIAAPAPAVVVVPDA